MKPILLTLILVAPCYGVPILDQVNDEGLGSVWFNGGYSYIQKQQGVTAGMDGQLLGIDLWHYGSFGNGTSVIGINLGEAWQYDEADYEVLVTLPNRPFPQIEYVDFSEADIQLSAGDKFTICVRGSDGDLNGIGLHGNGNYGPRYFGGMLWTWNHRISGEPGLVFDSEDYDYKFRTWMEPPPGPGDFNEDGLVDDADLAVWQVGFGTEYSGSDLLDWQRNQTVIAAVTSVPEPSSLVLLALVLLAQIKIKDLF